MSTDALVNNYNPINFDESTPMDMINGVLGLAYGSEYLGSIIRDIDTLFYYQQQLADNSTVYLLREQFLHEDNS